MYPGLHQDRGEPQRACLSQLSLSFPAIRRGRASPATVPADCDFGICSCRAKRQEKAGKDCWSQSPPLEEPGPALHSPAGTRDTRRQKYKAEKMSHGNSKASRAGEVDWKEGEEELPSGLAPASISSGLTTPSWAGAPLMLMPGGRVQMGSQRTGYRRRGLLGRGWAQSP